VEIGKTPLWSHEVAKTLLDLIPRNPLSGLPDLAAYFRDVL
jgi:hypothetical protein